MSNAPTGGFVPVTVFDASGAATRAAFNRGSWEKVESNYNSRSGQWETTFTGRRVAQPVGWRSS
jgi:hypothetical protein